jgi:2-succinyl-6-hydroxy-2,4-cyclohexadiene-1-carboxylate synthase
MPLFGPPGERIGYEVYASAAAAPPIVLVHGFTASAASFLTNIPALRERFTVVTVDLLGHGASESPGEAAPYGPERAVRRIAELLDHLGYERVLLCGHSLGGALALRFALDEPGRLAGLIVINSNSAAGGAGWRAVAGARMREMGARVRAEGTAFLKTTRLYPAHSRRLPPDAKEQLVRDFERLTANGVAGTCEALTAQVNAWERLGELSVPMLLTIGDRDSDFLRNASAFIAQLPKERLRTVMLEGAGHAANLEAAGAWESAVFAFAEEIGYLVKG